METADGPGSGSLKDVAKDLLESARKPVVCLWRRVCNTLSYYTGW